MSILKDEKKDIRVQENRISGPEKLWKDLQNAKFGNMKEYAEILRSISSANKDNKLDVEKYSKWIAAQEIDGKTLSSMFFTGRESFIKWADAVKLLGGPATDLYSAFVEFLKDTPIHPAESAGGGQGAGAEGQDELPPALVEFWKQLDSGEVKDEIFSLKQGTSFLGNNDLGSRMLVRQCYVVLWQILQDTVAKGDRGMLVTGNPGIGKTWFLFWVLYLAKKQGRTVVTQNIPKTRNPVMRIFSPNGVRVSHYGGVEILLSQPRSDGVLYLIDGQAPVYVNAQATTLMVSSPKTERYKEFTRSFGIQKLYMPRWSFPEIYASVTRGAHTHLNNPESIEVVKYLYSLWGGIPRDVLQSAKTKPVQDSKAEIDAALAKAKYDEIIGFAGESEAGDNISRKILHIISYPPYSESTKRMDFASDYVKMSIFNSGILRETEATLKFLATTDPQRATLRGHVFESSAHIRISSGNTYRWRSLEESTSFPPLPTPAEFFRTEKGQQIIFSDLASVKSIDKRYHRPSSKSFCAIDAMIPGLNVFFQMTTQNRHPIKTWGVKKCLPHLSDPRGPVSFIFVVPAEKYPTFKKQPFVNKSRRGKGTNSISEEEEEKADMQINDELDPHDEEQQDEDVVIPDDMLTQYPPKNVRQYVLEMVFQ